LDSVNDFDRIDRELFEALDLLHRHEHADGWSSEEVMGAQRILLETAAYLRGFRPPASWDEAWQRIQKRRERGDLRGVGGR
jgi:hypothetical protein